MATDGNGRGAGWLGRIARLFPELRPGERGTALLLTLNVFFLLLAYYLLKVAREPLILLGGGAEVKSYAAAGQAVLLVLVALAYGGIARRVARVRLISAVTLFFAGNLLLFVALGARDVPLGVPFFLWVGVFNMTAVAQFWGFAADVYDEERGKRIFPMLGIGSSVGAVAGAWIARRAIALGPFALMLGAAALLAVCVALTVVIDRREAGRAGAPAEARRPVGGENGFSILLRDRYLVAIGALVLVLNWVNTSGEYILDRTVLAAAAGHPSPRELIGELKATYFMWVNAAGVLLQTFAVARVIKLLGVRRALFVMPAVSLVAYGAIALAPALGLVLVAKIAENSLDYSLQNTARHALWLPASRQAKYKVKQVVDSFLVRVGDVMSAGLVALGVALGLGTRGFAVANAGLVLVWLGVLVLLAREHRRRSATEAA
jgi:AAA family ATP:ADP antiporter